jgi:ligand-binding SRPBCC domain-containing protein
MTKLWKTRTTLLLASALGLAGSARGGLISYWNFNDGTNAIDVVSGYNAFSFSNFLGAATHNADTPPGGGAFCLDLTHGQDYVLLPATNYGISREFTLAAWAKYNSSERAFFSIKRDLAGGGGDRSGVCLGIQNRHGYVGIISSGPDNTANAGTTTFHDMETVTAVPTNEWVHLAATLKNDRVTYYINGVAETQYTGAGTPDGQLKVLGTDLDFVDANGSFTGFGADGNAPAVAGSPGNFTRLFFDGLLDEVAVWNVALPASAVTELAQGIAPLDLTPFEQIQPIKSFTASPEAVLYPGKVTLAWEVEVDATVTLADDLGNAEDVLTELGHGSFEVTPIRNITYTLTATLGDQTQSRSVKVTLNFPPAPVGLVSYWNFDDGVSATDKISGWNGLAFKNFPEGGTHSSDIPPSGGAFSLDLSHGQDYVILPATTYGIINEFTLSAWVNYTSSERSFFSVRRDLTAAIGTGDRSGISLGIQNGHAYTGVISSDTNNAVNSGYTYNDIETTTPVPMSEWVHLAATLQSDKVTLYINGVAETNYIEAGTPNQDGILNDLGRDIDFVDANGSFSGFGADGNAPRHASSPGDFTRMFYEGLLDEVAVWNKALSPAQVQRLANGESPTNFTSFETLLTSFTADTNRIMRGDSTTLRWVVAAGATVSLEPAIGNVDARTTNGLGSIQVNPINAISYTLSVTKGEQAQSASVKISVVFPQPPQGLVSYWDFNDGATVTDQVGDNDAVALKNFGGAEPFSSDTPPGGGAFALDLSHGKDYVLLPATTYGIETEFTFVAWVKYTASERSFFSIKRDLTSGGGDRSGVSLGIQNSHAYTGVVTAAPNNAANAGLTTFNDIETKTPVPQGDWVHLATTLKDGKVTMYINGVAETAYTGAGTADGVLKEPTTGLDLVDANGSFSGLGADGNGPAVTDSPGDFTRLFYEGLLDEVAVWNVALEPEDIQFLAAGGSPLGVATRGAIIVQSPTLDAGGFTFWWNSEVGRTYQIQMTTAFDGWSVLARDYPAGGATSDVTSFTDTTASRADRGRFYRVVYVPPPPLLSADFEGGSQGWEAGRYDGGGATSWELGTPMVGPIAAHSGTNVFGTGLNAEYAEGTDIYLRSPVIDLSAVASATVTFWDYYEIEEGFDFGYLNILDENGALLLPQLQTFTGTKTSWAQERIKLPEIAIGRRIILEFQLQSDYTFGLPGWYIDDVTVQSE